jgi:predicted nucleic acid-binding protein
VQPIRNHNAPLLALYDAFFAGLEVEVAELTAAVVEKATLLRAGLDVKTPDALHLATAILSGATAFLTGDKELVRCTDVPVEVF